MARVGKLSFNAIVQRQKTAGGGAHEFAKKSASLKPFSSKSAVDEQSHAIRNVNLGIKQQARIVVIAHQSLGSGLLSFNAPSPRGARRQGGRGSRPPLLWYLPAAASVLNSLISRKLHSKLGSWPRIEFECLILQNKGKLFGNLYVNLNCFSTANDVRYFQQDLSDFVSVRSLQSCCCCQTTNYRAVAWFEKKDQFSNQVGITKQTGFLPKPSRCT